MVKRLTNPFRDAPLPLGSLLNAAGQRLSSELDAALRAAGFADLRASHAAIFMAVEPAGSRLTDLAQQARMTKQAAGELVRYLSERSYFTTTSDATDGVIAGFDHWLDQVVGADHVTRLRQTLSLIAESEPTSRILQAE